MKLLIVLFALVALSLAMPTGPADVTDSEWNEFKTKHSKVYSDAAEDAKRRELYAVAKQKVEDHNKEYDDGKVTFTLGLNHLADLTDEEYKKYSGGVLDGVIPGSALPPGGK